VPTHKRIYVYFHLPRQHKRARKITPKGTIDSLESIAQQTWECQRDVAHHLNLQPVGCPLPMIAAQIAGAINAAVAHRILLYPILLSKDFDSRLSAVRFG
jgi:hypothetical protein